MTAAKGAVYRFCMPFRSLLARVTAAFRARPWSWLGGVFAAVLGVALLQALLVEPSLVPRPPVDSAAPAYPTVPDARAAIAAGRARAAETGKLLMVTFGANWCLDCLTLHANLREPATRAYVQEHFEIVDIDVGDAEKSAAVERDLGIAVNVIPLAMFYTPEGELIGDTVAGELKPSRHYNAREIRDFLREVVDYHRIVSPDQRQ
jgi:thiol:disulfide interchange protein